MKTVWKLYAATILLSACAALTMLSACAETRQAEEQTATVRPSLTDCVQTAIAENQKEALDSLPEEIEGLKTAEPVADRERKQRGAGFTRVYADGDVTATVFVYNNRNFGISEDPDTALEELMNKHLQEFRDLQDSGLYEDVNADEPKPRSFRWKSVKYQVLEASVRFSHKEEAKKSFVVLGANKDLMSYIRIRYTYPKSKQAEMNKKQEIFTRTVMAALHDFASAGK